LYWSRLRFFAGKLLSKWEGPFVIEEVYRSGAVKIASLKDDTTQVVNGQRLKHYISGDSYNEDFDVIQMMTLEEFIKEHITVNSYNEKSNATVKVNSYHCHITKREWNIRKYQFFIYSHITVQIKEALNKTLSQHYVYSHNSSKIVFIHSHITVQIN
jgi:hypothetical protein